jgi:FkbM family methyltransferase
MQRPWLLRYLPERLAMSLLARWYLKQAAHYAELYRGASLKANPKLKMNLVVGDIISDYIAFSGIYEASHTHNLIDYSRRRPGLMVDVGANLGYFSLLWSAAHPSNRCVAIKASPRNLQWLRENIALNQLQSKIIVIDRAVSDQPGVCRFDVGPESQTGHGGIVKSSANQPTNQVIEVPTVRIDQLEAIDQPVSLMKIDIEGAELFALKGCQRLLEQKQIQEIWFEQNIERMTHLEIPTTAPTDFLRQFGYEVEPIIDAHGSAGDWRAFPKI